MNRVIRPLGGALLALLLSGCITPYPDLTQSRSPCRMEPGGWCDFVREAAVKAYPYAMLSSNAYRDEDSFDALPLAFVRRETEDNDGSGLAYSVYDRFSVEAGKRGRLLARVIAFRGTEFGSAADIFSGSLGDSQRDGARKTYLVERSLLDAQGHSDVLIETTGHSLGGALATQISIDYPSVRAFVFNTSPFFSGDAMINDNARVAISERGEFLRLLRRYKAPVAADVTVINCNPSASAAAKHSIRKLGDCLTWIAAYADEEALGLIASNKIGKPEIECGDDDKTHPGVATARSAAARDLCEHTPRPAKPKQP